MNFTSPSSKLEKSARSLDGDAGPDRRGSVSSATFQLEGQDFAMNGGPMFAFTPAISVLRQL